ncbi:trace amine-associated receptor 9-like [Clytia hemisphaerica]|uniref:trace amine-associated receptor 9-like n=1 Tax=Clytia hemisphaerica TaxID=252671 RepID=UPI0034D65508
MELHLFRLIGGAIMGLGAFSCILLNSLLLIAVIRDPLKKLQKISNFLLVHLFACDLMVGLLFLTYRTYFVFVHFGDVNAPNYRKLSAVNSVFLYGDFFTAVCLSIDRYEAIMNPIQHRQKMDVKRYMVYSAIIWVSSLVFSADLVMYSTTSNLNAVKVFGVSIILIIILMTVYIRVRMTMRSQENNRQHEDLLASHDSSRSVISTRLTRRKNVIQLLTLILVMELVTFLIMAFTETYVASRGNKLSYETKQAMGTVRFFMYALNVIFNPTICIVKMKNFRHSIKALFTCSRKPSTSPRTASQQSKVT